MMFHLFLLQTVKGRNEKEKDDCGRVGGGGGGGGESLFDLIFSMDI